MNSAGCAFPAVCSFDIALLPSQTRFRIARTLLQGALLLDFQMSGLTAVSGALDSVSFPNLTLRFQGYGQWPIEFPERNFSMRQDKSRAASAASFAEFVVRPRGQRISVFHRGRHGAVFECANQICLEEVAVRHHTSAFIEDPQNPGRLCFHRNASRCSTGPELVRPNRSPKHSIS